MLQDIINDYPGLGPLLYGQWKNSELNGKGFLILVGTVSAVLLLVLACGIAGYALQSVALCRIAKKQGAWRNIRTMACLPFARYFALGKIAERCDVIQNSEKRRLWGKRVLIVCCLIVPLIIALLLVAVIGIFGTQLLIMIGENQNSITRGIDSDVLRFVINVVDVFLCIIALPALLLNAFANELFTFLMVSLPFAGFLCLLLGMACTAVVRTLCGKCYYRILCTYYGDTTSIVWTVVGALMGWTPIVLFAASLKKNKIA